MLKPAQNTKIVVSVICGIILSLYAGYILAAETPLLDQEKLNKAIQTNIEKNMPWPAGSMRFEILSQLPEISIPAGKVSWKVDIKGNSDYLGDTYFVLKMYSKGVLFKEETIRVRIEVLHESVVSVKNLGRDTILSAGDVALQKRWVRAIPLNSINRMEEVAGKLLCVSVRPNTEISRNMLKEITAVRRNKMVQIVLESGAINITATGIAEEDGAEGSFVRVRNMSSNKIIYARVIGESQVKVDFR